MHTYHRLLQSTLSNTMRKTIKVHTGDSDSLIEKSDFEVEVQVFPSEEIAGAERSSRHAWIMMSAASASYRCRGEDRYVMNSLSTCPDLAFCQLSLNGNDTSSTPIMLAFCGVFDGHDGPTAADYCAKGLASHILRHTWMQADHNLMDQSQSSDMSPYHCDLIAEEISDNFGGDEVVAVLPPQARNKQLEPLRHAYHSAFREAQTCIGAGEPAISIGEALKISSSRIKRRSWRDSRRLLFGGKSDASVVAPGGTTACCLSIYQDPQTKAYFALIANCGDSRMLTDDPPWHAVDDNDDNVHQKHTLFHPVTIDHRPNEPHEKRRLSDCMMHGTAWLSHDVTTTTGTSGAWRIFPGGLAVSRTIGDAAHCAAVVPVPDLGILPLPPAARPRRFVLATDGLFDFVDNATVGRLAAQQQTDPSTTTTTTASSGSEAAVSPEQAAIRVMERALQLKAYQDDVTVVVVDILVALPGE